PVDAAAIVWEAPAMLQVRCPPPAALEGLFLGGLPENEAEVIEQHVLHCAACLEQLKTLSRGNDTLAGSLRETRSDETGPSPRVAALINNLKSLRTAAENPLPRGSAMITFSCSGCRKKHSVKEELAGKKVSVGGVAPARPAHRAPGADSGAETLFSSGSTV